MRHENTLRKGGTVKVHFAAILLDCGTCSTTSLDYQNR